MGGYLYIMDGAAAVAGSGLSAGDAAKMEGPEHVGPSAEAAAELILVDVPLEFRPVDRLGAVAAGCPRGGSSMEIEVISRGNMARGIATRALPDAVTPRATTSERSPSASASGRS